MSQSPAAIQRSVGVGSLVANSHRAGMARSIKTNVNWGGLSRSGRPLRQTHNSAAPLIWLGSPRLEVQCLPLNNRR